MGRTNYNATQCIARGCAGESQHRSGLCEKCRTHTCVACGTKFVAKMPRFEKRPLCAECLKNGKRPHEYCGAI